MKQLYNIIIAMYYLAGIIAAFSTKFTNASNFEAIVVAGIFYILAGQMEIKSKLEE